MKTCSRCFGKGYIEETYLKSLNEYHQTLPCPKCKDTKAYSDHIKNKYGNDNETQQEKINRLIGRNKDG